VTYQHERIRAIIDEHLPVAQRTLDSVTLTVSTLLDARIAARPDGPAG
jgi:hypothetical protein